MIPPEWDQVLGLLEQPRSRAGLAPAMAATTEELLARR